MLQTDSNIIPLNKEIFSCNNYMFVYMKERKSTFHLVLQEPIYHINRIRFTLNYCGPSASPFWMLRPEDRVSATIRHWIRKHVKFWYAINSS